MNMFSKYFRQYRQNRNWTIIIDFIRGAIFVKECYFCFFPFTWKKRVTPAVKFLDLIFRNNFFMFNFSKMYSR